MSGRRCTQVDTTCVVGLLFNKKNRETCSLFNTVKYKCIYMVSGLLIWRFAHCTQVLSHQCIPHVPFSLMLDGAGLISVSRGRPHSTPFLLTMLVLMLILSNPLIVLSLWAGSALVSGLASILVVGQKTSQMRPLDVVCNMQMPNTQVLEPSMEGLALFTFSNSKSTLTVTMDDDRKTQQNSKQFEEALHVEHLHGHQQESIEFSFT